MLNKELQLIICIHQGVAVVFTAVNEKLSVPSEAAEACLNNKASEAAAALQSHLEQ